MKDNDKKTTDGVSDKSTVSRRSILKGGAALAGAAAGSGAYLGMASGQGGFYACPGRFGMRNGAEGARPLQGRPRPGKARTRPLLFSTASLVTGL